MSKEIERKWLLHGSVASLLNAMDMVSVEPDDYQHIKQAYLSDTIRVRHAKILKENKDLYTMTIKSKGGQLVRDEREFEISKEEFEAIAKLNIKKLEKTRLTLPDGLIVDEIGKDNPVDHVVYILEKEFKSNAEAMAFDVSTTKFKEYIEKEVTEDANYNNCNFAYKYDFNDVIGG